MLNKCCLNGPVPLGWFITFVGGKLLGPTFLNGGKALSSFGGVGANFVGKFSVVPLVWGRVKWWEGELVGRFAVVLLIWGRVGYGGKAKWWEEDLPRWRFSHKNIFPLNFGSHNIFLLQKCLPQLFSPTILSSQDFFVPQTLHPGLVEIPAPVGSQDVMSRMRDYPFRQ